MNNKSVLDISSDGECGNVPVHTATPWQGMVNGRFGDFHGYEAEHKDGDIEFGPINAGDDTVALVVSRRLYSEEVVNNAAFIVRAVNAHAELLAALEATLALVESDYQSARVDGNWPDVAPIMEQARQAIARAKE